MRAIEQRLMKLEQAVSKGASLHAWADVGETAEQAVTRRFPGGLAHNATVKVYCWAGDQTLLDAAGGGWR